MTEHEIFKILLNSEKIDYPKLNQNSVNVVATHFTNIIYDTIKQKSTASVTKRTNILKFLKHLCEVKEPHLKEDSYKVFVQSFKHKFIDSDKLNEFLKLSQCDLKKVVSHNLSEDVINFKSRKNCRRKNNIHRLEIIRKLDEEKLKLQFNSEIPHFLCYETNEDLVKNLLNIASDKNYDSNHEETKEYREKQVKLAYALNYIKNKDSSTISNKILKQISNYKNLYQFEVNYLMYAFELDDANYYTELLLSKFPFVYEKSILKICKNILSLQEDTEMDDYLIELLESNKALKKILEICNDDPQFRYKINSIVFQLYSYSFCNSNILKFCNLF